MKKYIKPSLRILSVKFEGFFCTSPLSSSEDAARKDSDVLSRRKDNGADIWSGNISWGYDADE